ncbi:MAG: hypothetical protein H7Y09_06265 [Chitinophagaceae bacterium]|nr:hypothetical protein [Anaerolineae bacterium]
MFKNDFTFTKRQLGLLLLIIGTIGFAAVVGIDLVDAGREGGIGPVQRVALGTLALMAVLGLSLIPLGNDLA